MRLLLFVSVFGILISIAVLIVVIMKARRGDPPSRSKGSDQD